MENTESHQIPETSWTLPQPVYEALRWALTLVIPAALTLVAALNGALSLNLPMEAIYTVATAVVAFLGAIFGISKVNNDKNNA